MNKIITETVKVAVTTGALAAALTGCCLFKSDENRCCRKCCCTRCCDSPTKECSKPKTSGMNTSMTVGVGTDGVNVGGAANVGNHGMSGSAGGSMH